MTYQLIVYGNSPVAQLAAGYLRDRLYPEAKIISYYDLEDHLTIRQRHHRFCFVGVTPCMKYYRDMSIYRIYADIFSSGFIERHKRAEAMLKANAIPIDLFYFETSGRTYLEGLFDFHFAEPIRDDYHKLIYYLNKVLRRHVHPTRIDVILDAMVKAEFKPFTRDEHLKNASKHFRSFLAWVDGWCLHDLDRVDHEFILTFKDKRKGF